MKKYLLLIISALSLNIAYSKDDNTEHVWKLSTEISKINFVPNDSLVFNKKYVQLLSNGLKNEICIPDKINPLDFLSKEMIESECHTYLTKKNKKDHLSYTCKYEDAFNSQIIFTSSNNKLSGTISTFFINHNSTLESKGKIEIIKTEQTCNN